MEPESMKGTEEASMHGWTPNPEAEVHLSDREQQVLVGIAEGLTNRELAEKLGIGIKTVESYRARLVAKLGLRTRGELANYARSRQLGDNITS